MKTLGSRIAYYRKLAGMSQTALASACHWKSQSRIGNYESDTREPSLADLEKIAKVLGVAVQTLTYGNDGDLHLAESNFRNAKDRVVIAAALASPKSRATLERIAQAAEEGLLTDDDIQALELIAKRIMQAKTNTPQSDLVDDDGSNTRLRNRLNAAPDTDPQQ